MNTANSAYSTLHLSIHVSTYTYVHIYYKYIYRRQAGYEPTGRLRSAKSMCPQPQPLPPPHQQLYYAELYAAAHTSTVTKQPPSLPLLPRQTPFLRWLSLTERKRMQVEGWTYRQKG